MKIGPENAKDSFPSSDAGVVLPAWTLGLVTTGVLYVGIFLPLVWHAAREARLDPLNALLFAELPTSIRKHVGWTLLPLVDQQDALPFLYAYGVLYGVCGFLSAALLQFAARHDLATVVVAANGLLWGYYSAIYLSSNLLKLIVVPAYSMLSFRLAYIVLLFIVIHSLRMREVRRAKYNTLLDGIYGIIVSFLLTKGFGKEAASILTGPIFLVCCFVSTVVAEQSIGRYVYAFSRLEEPLDELGKLVFKDRLRLMLRWWWKLARSYRGEEFYLRLPDLRFRRAWCLNKRLFLAVALISWSASAGFPLAAYFIARFLWRTSTCPWN